ncbi:MAG: hypothetical protein A2Z25_03925 [Planctomycetes bacterium RBG_16_55_9]|nr:MAG: hypothetical protein A2Z25_03925 [Planctomycetes bacterium RBG_16_55_9]
MNGIWDAEDRDPKKIEHLAAIGVMNGRIGRTSRISVDLRSSAVYGKQTQSEMQEVFYSGSQRLPRPFGPEFPQGGVPRHDIFAFMA